jgi:phage protein D
MTANLTPKFEVQVDGATLAEDTFVSIVSVGIRQDLVLADMIELRLRNEDLRFTDSDLFAEGKELKVKLGYVETDLKLMATGTIARRECDFPERGPAQVTVVAYDKRFTLKQGSKTRAWTNVKASDVASELIQAAGLKADVDDTGIKLDYLFQPAMTDLAFLAERAAELGFEVHLDRENQTVSFKKPDPMAPADTSFEWGKNLLSFRPRFTTSAQPGPVTVRGYDMKAKKDVQGKATSADLESAMGLGRIGAAIVEKVYGARDFLVTGPATSAGEAKDMAKAAINQALPEFASATGSVQGNNAIDAGGVIELKAVGKRASGKYYVSSTLHLLAAQGYVTHFECSRPGESPVPEAGSTPKKAQRTGDPGGFSMDVGHATKGGDPGAVTASVAEHDEDAAPAADSSS